jgi:phosphate transport system protein
LPQRVTLDNKLRHLLDEILIMDSMVESATLEAVNALKNRNIDLARRIVENDKLINERRLNLENDIIVTIATTQPVMAGDLRLVASIIDVVNELERMGDYAKGIATIAIQLGNQPPVKPLIDIPQMAEIAVDMLHKAISAFIAQDAEIAREIPKEDDRVDTLYIQVYRELVAIMLSDPTTIDRANSLMWAAHNLERMADRVTNICERTIFVATGELVELAPSDKAMKQIADIM